MSKEEIKQEFEKQLQKLSQLSDKSLSMDDRLRIAGKIIEICNALVFFSADLLSFNNYLKASKRLSLKSAAFHRNTTGENLNGSKPQERT